MVLLNIVQGVLFLFAGGVLLYVMTLTLLAFFPRLRREFPVDRYRRIAILIPAHNEEKGIAATVAALTAIDYPADAFERIVIADNCSDGTAGEARAAGARVVERNDPELRGKGYALRWAIDLLGGPESGFDAFVVIDADSVPSENFLRVMNWYLAQGADAIQGADVVDPRNRGWSAQMTRIGFLLYNYVRPLGRRTFGGSAGLRGNGMCFRRDLFERIPWNAFTIGEDLEFGLHLLLQGVRVEFAPEGVVHAVMPEESHNAVSQRARWEGSRFGLIRAYALPLLRKGLSEGSIPSLDALLDLVTPAMVNLIGFTVMMVGVNTLFLLAGVPGSFPWILLWGGGVALGLLHLFLGLLAAGADRGTYLALFSIPRYALWKILVYAGMRKRRGAGWVRTARE